MFPKPIRVKNRAILDAYRLEHPECEVSGCRQTPMPTPHHIRPRSLGQDDRPQNCLSLCWTHHVGPEGFHTIGKHTWFKRFQDNLSPEARLKVATVLGYGDANGRHTSDA